MFKSTQFQNPTGLGRIALTGFFLGMVMMFHLLMFVWSWVYYSKSQTLLFYQWSIYMTGLSFFHFSEFISTAAWKPESLSYDSFLLNHSQAYTAAIIASWLEFWIEFVIFPALNYSSYMLFCGSIFMLVGLYLRIMAMWTAKSNFSHRIEYVKRNDHVLITNGIYRYIRHPAYMGWFLWSIGTQVLLCNPLCVVAYSTSSWYFFHDRIQYEEEVLNTFFSKEYPAYKARTISGIPFIK